MPAAQPLDDNGQAELHCAFQNLDMDKKNREALLRYKTQVSPDERKKYPLVMMSNVDATQLILDVVSKFVY